MQEACTFKVTGRLIIHTTFFQCYHLYPFSAALENLITIRFSFSHLISFFSYPFTLSIEGVGYGFTCAFPEFLIHFFQVFGPMPKFLVHSKCFLLLLLFRLSSPSSMFSVFLFFSFPLFVYLLFLSISFSGHLL